MRNLKEKTYIEILEDFDVGRNFWNDEDVAFIKSDEESGQWLIYSAEGVRLAATEDRDFAFIIARQNELSPKSVH